MKEELTYPRCAMCGQVFEREEDLSRHRHPRQAIDGWVHMRRKAIHAVIRNVHKEDEQLEFDF